MEQIKENIKKHKNDAEVLSDKLQGGIAAQEFQIKNQKTLDQLEDQLHEQRDKFNELQSSSKYGTKNAQSKEELEFELSKGSPIKSKNFQSSQRGQGANAGTSSSNLEKAYEELEKEILEIKMKLHNSISANESQVDPSSIKEIRTAVAKTSLAILPKITWANTTLDLISEHQTEASAKRKWL